MTSNLRSSRRKKKRWTWVLIGAALLVSAGGYLWFTEVRPWVYGLQAYLSASRSS